MQGIPRNVSALLSAVESVGRPAHESASLREIRRFGARGLHRQHAGIPTAHCRVLLLSDLTLYWEAALKLVVQISSSLDRQGDLE